MSSASYKAPSGKTFVIAKETYPSNADVEKDKQLIQWIVGANKGDLIQLFFMHDGWAFGQRFKPREGKFFKR